MTRLIQHLDGIGIRDVEPNCVQIHRGWLLCKFIHHFLESRPMHGNRLMYIVALYSAAINTSDEKIRLEFQGYISRKKTPRNYSFRMHRAADTRGQSRTMNAFTPFGVPRGAPNSFRNAQNGPAYMLQ